MISIGVISDSKSLTSHRESPLSENDKIRLSEETWKSGELKQ